VWDSVGSLGIPGSLFAASNKAKFAFHDTNSSPLVRRAVQALAIDEHRHDFTPTFWAGAVPSNVSIEQVWFAGAHADVGGGIPLVWMAKPAEAAGLPLTGHAYPTRQRLTSQDLRQGCLRLTAIIRPYRDWNEEMCRQAQ
jgi:hypothetical protein